MYELDENTSQLIWIRSTIYVKDKYLILHFRKCNIYTYTHTYLRI